MTNPDLDNDTESDSDDQFGIMGILKSIKIDDMPPPMEGVKVEV